MENELCGLRRMHTLLTKAIPCIVYTMGVITVIVGLIIYLGA